MKGAVRTAVGCALVALAVGPLASTSGQTAGPATADKEGWWSQVGRTPVPHGVPEGAIAVAARLGQPEKVAALGVVLDAERGSTVQSFTLTLLEAEGTGAQQNAAGAVIVACPVIDFFAGDVNGAWEDAPEADCDAASSEGVRNDDGTWTFDLVPLADLWLDPFGTVAANGVRFDPGDATFQVSFTGMEDAVFDVALTPPQEDDDPFDTATTTVPGGFTGPSSGSSGGGIDVSPPPAVDAPEGDTPVAGEEPAAAPDDGDDAGETARPSPSRAGDITGNLPGGVLVLVIVMLLGAGSVALALGPAGRQGPSISRRTGGVTRALEARATSTPGAQT